MNNELRGGYFGGREARWPLEKGEYIISARNTTHIKPSVTKLL